MKKLIYLSALTCMFLGCKNENNSEENEPIAQHNEVVFDGISPSIKPGDNFFNHVNKNWYDAAVIAEDQVGVGAYRFLNIPQQELLKEIL